ncbi:ATP phosphoribosyltransferase [Synchytrium endobioticum]|uniref:ATP phosphoribosyltransferase n=1 Tax=Synchytrium endobioticum TaxID=286115 RepID=A0A507CTR6_9FUNG|nr:ATP phosphoribosyltransferase [Synchytrium endobioticum]TPX43557.1 ATP phosphoribosyltransferase [Synchytrium endobioticum]
MTGRRPWNSEKEMEGTCSRPAVAPSIFDTSELSSRLFFAIPKKGRLHEHCIALLQGADIQFKRGSRVDIALSSNLPIALVFLPAADIAKFVADGNVDLGITGQDVVRESGVDVEEVMGLGFGKCNLSVQVPISSGVKDVRELVGKRIVTSFERLVYEFFAELEGKQPHPPNETLTGQESGATAIIPVLETRINYVSGSVEAACGLGLADAVVDLVESGETMRAANLHAIHILCPSEAVLICNKAKKNSNALIAKIARRIEGVITAQRYALINYNVPRSFLSRAIQITPGKQAPTISPLEHNNWVAVSAMVMKNKVAEMMDELEGAGATDILVFNINNCRV